MGRYDLDFSTSHFGSRLYETTVSAQAPAEMSGRIGIDIHDILRHSEALPYVEMLPRQTLFSSPCDIRKSYLRPTGVRFPSLISRTTTHQFLEPLLLVI